MGYLLLLLLKLLPRLQRLREALLQCVEIEMRWRWG